MKKLMFVAAMLGFAVACGPQKSADAEAVEEAQVVETVVEEAAPAPKAEAKAEVEAKAEQTKVAPGLTKPADVKADEKAAVKEEGKVEAEKPAATASDFKVNNNVKVVEKKDEPKKIEQAGGGVKRVK